MKTLGIFVNGKYFIAGNTAPQQCQLWGNLNDNRKSF